MEDQGEDVERTVLPRHREVQYLDRRNTDVEDRGKKIQVAFHPVSVRDPKGDREVEELVKNDREVEHYQKEVKVPVRKVSLVDEKVQDLDRRDPELVNQKEEFKIFDYEVLQGDSEG